MPFPEPRPGVLEIPLYEGGKSRIKGARQVIKLSSNESPFGPSPMAVEAYRSLESAIHRYPSGRAEDLKLAIADVQGLDLDCIICGAGSDEIFLLLCRAYAGPGDEIIHSRHGFLMYNIYAQSVGATPVVVPETNLTVDVEGIINSVTDRTRLVFIANPNNPTGTYVTSDSLLELRKRLREDIVLVIDSAYAEYMTQEDYDPGLLLANTTPNTVMTRTFSKIYGLAALRLGWAYGPKSIIDALARLRSPFNVAAPAQVAGAAAIRDQEFMEMVKAHNAKWMSIMIQRLSTLGLPAGGTAGNFVLPCFPDHPGLTAADADSFLQSCGIIVRRVDNYGLPNHLRISIGLDDEMEAVLDTLGRFMESRGV